MFLNSYVGWFCSCLIRLEQPWFSCVLMNNSETRSSRDIKADMLYGDILFCSNFEPLQNETIALYMLLPKTS